MRNSIRMRFALAGAAAVVLGAGVGIATATHTVHISSKVTITKTAPVFSGKVKSKNAACQDHRKVKLHVVEQDNDVVGKDKTGNQGRWRIHFQGEGTAHYYASVAKRKEGAAGTTYVCEHDISKPIAAP